MASQQQQAVTAPPHVVGNAFVQQYYHILHQSPELVHHFYQDTSKLGRPDSAGVMSSITTTQAIDEKILSLEFKDYRAEIKTVDAQESYSGGVLVLVTGYLTGKDNIKKNFTQTFFLAPQEKGYFVLNDMFRYVEAADQQQPQQQERQGSQGSDKDETSSVHEQDASEHKEQGIHEGTVTPPEEEEGEEMNIEEVYNPSDNWDGSVVDEEAPVNDVVDEVPNSSLVVVDSNPATAIEEAPKKSYASIVKVMRENSAPSSVPSASSVRPPPVNPEWQPAPVPTSSPPKVEAPSSGSHAPETGNVQEAEADGYSIYIKSLPLNATAAQLEEEFKRFGPIKPGGIQVRSHKQQGFCFGFVEFEVASAVQSAIEASPVVIGGRQAYVEEKRPSGSRIGGRGRFGTGRGGFRGGDGPRGRGGYGGGRGGYGRGDYGGRPDFGNRVSGGGRGGPSGRGEAGYQRVDHNSSRTGRAADCRRARGPPRASRPRPACPLPRDRADFPTTESRAPPTCPLSPAGFSVDPRARFVRSLSLSLSLTVSLSLSPSSRRVAC
ncbi:unnamed protein product [Spirodela intermedia]|uniref:Uncharacterized protein n=1 Tax=Spirodela intermedia TaxID=51605 RepID=A0A7I8IRU1_SPIIN|nr:unnamed protein product [Spirodela intermedia]CAA6659884.1 unnamed protein product [Spirodela intermedia]